MKSNRILQIVFIALIIVLVGMAGFVYFADSGVVKQRQDKIAEIAKNQTLLNNSNAAKRALQNEASDMEKQLAAAKDLLAQSHIQSSVESIEYNRILGNIADENNVNILNVNVSAPSDVIDAGTTYQLTTFNIIVEAKTPEKLFTATEDSRDYLTNAENNILAFISAIDSSANFNSAQFQSVNISTPEPMNTEQLNSMIETVNSQIFAELTIEEIQNYTTVDEISALIASKLAAIKAGEIQVLLDQAGIKKPSAEITIGIWTLKGA